MKRQRSVHLPALTLLNNNDVLDEVIAHLPYISRFALRQVCRHMRERINAYVARLPRPIILCWQGDSVESGGTPPAHRPFDVVTDIFGWPLEVLREGNARRLNDCMTWSSRKSVSLVRALVSGSDIEKRDARRRITESLRDEGFIYNTNNDYENPEYAVTNYIGIQGPLYDSLGHEKFVY